MSRGLFHTPLITGCLCVVAMEILGGSTDLWAQGTTQNDSTPPAIYVSKALSFSKSIELRDIEPVLFQWKENKPHEVFNSRRRNKYVNEDALPKGDDPAWQKGGVQHFNRAPIENWNGLTNAEGGSTPPDPSGAAGPNHYVQMVNMAYKIYDKAGNVLYGPASLNSLLGGGNNGDPIVMYDKFADRWFMSQFDPPSTLRVAVSQTPDPLGAYYLYTFSTGTFPDYPKYSVWTDGYYVTANKSGQRCYAMERDKMLVGNPGAQFIGYTIPSINTNGFFSAMPSHADGTSLPAPGTPLYLFYFQDDGWAGVSQDHIKVWEVRTDWGVPSNSTISAPTIIPVSPFDSEFTVTWEDIPQPNTQRLDAVPGALMYMAQYREWWNYNTIVLNHTVDVDATNHAGIRWYELRQQSGTWSLHQEGTFAPDADSRWLGSAAMDYQGNIALAYSVSGVATFPSIRYTGRYACDPLGQMTLAEQNIVNGTSSQSGTERFGDYAQMTLDPDDATFWYTGEYISSGWKTRISSFQLASLTNDDLAAVAVVTPVDGVLSAAETITVTVNNFGTLNQSAFPVSYSINGGVPVTEIYPGTLNAGANNNFVFASTANMGVPGSYDIKIYTGLAGDQFHKNDTSLQTVDHLYNNDVGVSVITAPSTGFNLSAAETISVTIQNYGAGTQSNFPVSYHLDGGPVVTEIYGGSIAIGNSASYNFVAKGDFSALGQHEIVAYTGMLSDLNNWNDTTVRTVENTICQPNSDCTLDDNLILFRLGSVNNPSGCPAGGYTDFTSLITDLKLGSSNDLSVDTDFPGQRLTVWIDYDDNYVFDVNERPVTNFVFGTNGGTTILDVPLTAPLGQHLLRARTRYNASIIDPCADVSYGETEDYTVNIISDIAAIDETFVAPNFTVNAAGLGRFHALLPGVQETAAIEIHNTIGQLVHHATIYPAPNGLDYTFDLSREAAGYYLVKVYNENFSMVRKIIRP